jgi:hypothetical protein
MTQPQLSRRIPHPAAWPIRLLALILVLALAGTPKILAQVAGLAGTPGAAPKELHIVILEGEDALNNIRQRTAREPIVQVEDENHKPVAGALVLFTIHGSASGAGGSFAGATSLSVTTGADGQAVAKGFTPNATKGSYTIEVTATLGALTALVVVHQTSAVVAGNQTQQQSGVVPPVLHAHHFGTKFWLISGGIAGGIIAIFVLNNNAGATITAGTGTVHP